MTLSTKETHNPPSALIQWPCAPLLFFLLGALTQRKAAAQKPSLTSVRARFPFRPGTRTAAEHQERATGVGAMSYFLRVHLCSNRYTRDKSPHCRNHVLQIKITLAVQLLQISIM
jgi:hypothetical protein